jgi:hypothetical protein
LGERKINAVGRSMLRPYTTKGGSI